MKCLNDAVYIVAKIELRLLLHYSDTTIVHVQNQLDHYVHKIYSFQKSSNVQKTIIYFSVRVLYYFMEVFKFNSITK